MVAVPRISPGRKQRILSEALPEPELIQITYKNCVE